MILVALCLAGGVRAQTGADFLDRFGSMALERAVFARDTSFHPAVVPFRQNEVRAVLASADSAEIPGSACFGPYISGSLGGKWYGGLSPMLDLSAEAKNVGSALFRTAGGIQASLRYGDKLEIFGAFFGGLERAPEYINTFSDSLGVLPGLGRNRGSGDLSAFALPAFAVMYSPSRFFQVDAGFGTNSFGSGYRSLLLSDAAYNYPYLKLTTDVWRFKYTNLFAAMTHIGDEAVRSENFRPKYTAAHHLSWAVSRRVTVSVFESVLWQGSDSLSDRGFDPHYLNPVIFYRPVEFAMGSPDRMLVGADVQVRLGKKAALYGQFMLDEFLLENLRERNGWWANKWGIQAGATVFDPLGLEGLRLQGEFNMVRPFTYSHGSPLQSYTHFNQPLAHPLGSNFYEAVFFADYERGTWFAGSHTVVSRYGRDGGANMGGNIFRSYANPEMIFGNRIAQGVRNDLIFQRVSVGKVIHRKMNLRLSLRATVRALSTEGGSYETEAFAGISLSTGFFNRYRDF